MGCVFYSVLFEIPNEVLYIGIRLDMVSHRILHGIKFTYCAIQLFLNLHSSLRLKLHTAKANPLAVIY